MSNKTTRARTSSSSSSSSPTKATPSTTASASASPMRSPMRTTTASARPLPPPRPRMNSKDIPRTYSGLYGDGSDLLPFELSRNRNTDWMMSSQSSSGLILLATYLFVIVVGEFVMMALLPLRLSWTVAHVLHFIVTLVYLHWIKGSPNFYEQGEMNAMTTWEQLESTPSGNFGDHQRKALLIVPTLLCYFACHFCNYEPRLCTLNAIIWFIAMLAKMPFMNGVRILGINRTTGIDDDDDNVGAAASDCKRD